MRQVTFYEVVRVVYDPEWDRYESQLIWTANPMVSDVETGNTRTLELSN